MAARSQGEIPKTYDPSTTEGPLYQFWLDGGYSTPRTAPEKQPFCIIMPPPNVTGELHLGHALTATMEDALIRWHRLRGDPTLWLPGVDHAGTATQNVVQRAAATPAAARSWWGASGGGSTSTEALSPASKCAWALPAIGGARCSRWTAG